MKPEDLSQNIIYQLLELARNAGQEVLKVYAQDFAIAYKEDNSPLTAADRASNEVIVDGLSRIFPGIPIISEELRQTDWAQRKNWRQCWLVDPLDGTKEFIKKNGEFTVNIALIENSAPIFGVVYAPVPDVLYYGVKEGGSFRIDKRGKEILKGGENYLNKKMVRVVGSRSHMNDQTLAFISDLQKEGRTIEFYSVGSSLKICMVAEGAADVYPRFGPTMEWDTAAADAIARFAGRSVLDISTKQPLNYNKPDLRNPSFMVF